MIKNSTLADSRQHQPWLLSVSLSKKAMFGQMTTPEMKALLQRQLVGRLGCCNDGIPYVVPLSYAFSDPCIYGYTYEGKKMDILRRNSRVCFEVSDTSDLSNWKSVICQGIFEELNSPEEKNTALNILNSRTLPFISSKTMQLSPEWPFSGDQVSHLSGVFFRINIIEMSGRYEKADAETFFAT